MDRPAGVPSAAGNGRVDEGAAPRDSEQPSERPDDAPGDTRSVPYDQRSQRNRSSSAGARKTYGASSRARLGVPTYAALDLGTNNCRLLVAQPTRRGFHVVDAFSRIIRLGEGVSSTGLLSEAAMTRTFEALRVCARKITRHQATRARLVATEACRKAENAGEFIAAVRRDLDLELEILSREAEARLAVSGCAALIDQSCDLAVVFDIGGGSTEIIWLDLGGSKEPNQWRRTLADRLDAYNNIAAWTSLPAGVVTLAERFGGEHVTPEVFEAMVEDVLSLIAPFEQEHRFADVVRNGRVHMVGTSGTVTTLAGIMLGLQRYDRKRVDGSWMTIGEIRRITDGLLAQTYSERVAEPCIGRDRADLVLAGCAILEALIRMWPVDRLRVADRGLREGILATLMADDGHFRGSD
ncbi:MAG: hypothetical protein RLZ98_2362 [Pseudomonadota bacterium]